MTIGSAIEPRARCRKRKFLTHRFGVPGDWAFGRGGLARLSEVRRVEVDIKERTNKRGGKGPTMRCNSDTGHKVMTSPTGQKPCRRRPLCVQSLVYKFIAHYHFILQRYSLWVGSLLQSLSSASSARSHSLSSLSHRVKFRWSERGLTFIDFRLQFPVTATPRIDPGCVRKREFSVHELQSGSLNAQSNGLRARTPFWKLSRWFGRKSSTVHRSCHGTHIRRSIWTRAPLAILKGLVLRRHFFSLRTNIGLCHDISREPNQRLYSRGTTANTGQPRSRLRSIRSDKDRVLVVFPSNFSSDRFSFFP